MERGKVGIRPGNGLYIVKKFLKAYHGSVRIESEGKGKGTAFVLRMSVPY